MPTSGSYNYTTTRDEIISSAFRKIGSLGDYETIDTPRLNAGIAALNPMIKAFHVKGMPVWATDELYIPMTEFATIGYKSIGPTGDIVHPYAPLKVIQASRRDNTVAATPIDTPMNIYSYDDYRNLSSKASTGAPVHLFYQPLNYTGQLAVWPLPDSYWQGDGELYIRFTRPFQDFDASTDEPDFPTYWHEAIIYNLATRLAPEYGHAGLDRQILVAEAKQMLEDALGYGTEEGSIFLMPDKRWR